MVWWWPEAELEAADRAILSALLAGLGIFGRGDAWCDAELLDAFSVNRVSSGEVEPASSRGPRARAVPAGARVALAGLEPVRVLVPDLREGSFLETLYLTRTTSGQACPGSDLVASKADPGPSKPGLEAEHARRAAGNRARDPEEPTRVRDGGPALPSVQVARYLLDSSELPRLEDVLPFCEHARRALIYHRAAGRHSRAVTGKTLEGTPLEGHGHVHFLGTDEDSDGRIDHLTLYAPAGFDGEDLAAIGRLAVLTRGRDRPPLRLALAALGDPASLPEVPLFLSARRWRSATPFSLPRFGSRGANKPPRPRDLPEAQLGRELRARGLPAPARMDPIDGAVVAGRSPVRWADFHARRQNGTQGYGLAGFDLEFAEPVSGPLCLGFACHFGLGLFLPLP